MKNSILMALSFAFVMMISNTLFAQKTYTVDSEASTLAWVGKKVTGQHNGEITIKSGSVDFSKTKLDGSFTIDMTSINVLDLEGEYKGKLEGHLKSDDFFSVEKFPTAKFEITKATTKGNGEFDVTGNLTIKGITNPVSFPAKVTTTSEGLLKATADIVFDRSKWDVKYGSGSFFDGLGDKMIYDDVELSLELIAK